MRSIAKLEIFCFLRTITLLPKFKESLQTQNTIILLLYTGAKSTEFAWSNPVLVLESHWLYGLISSESIGSEESKVFHGGGFWFTINPRIMKKGLNHSSRTIKIKSMGFPLRNCWLSTGKRKLKLRKETGLTFVHNWLQSYTRYWDYWIQKQVPLSTGQNIFHKKVTSRCFKILLWIRREFYCLSRRFSSKIIEVIKNDWGRYPNIFINFKTE